MDPRLKALVEVRDLLKAEGWAPDESDSDNSASAPARRPILRPNLILTVICLAAVATNFVLIGANHDLRQGRSAIVTVIDVRIEGEDYEVPILPKIFLKPNQVKNFCFATVDGERVWEGHPKSIAGQESVNGSSGSPSVLIGAKGLFQLWCGYEGRAILLGQLNISSDHPDGWSDEIEVPDSKLGEFHFRAFVRLKVAKSGTSAIASSRANPRS